MVFERTALTRARIVESARRTVATEGLDALSLRRVARDLGVTAPALYAYVDDKLDLLRAVAETEFGRLLERLEAVDAADPIDRIRDQCHAYVRHAVDEPALFQVMFLFRPDWSPQEAVEELPVVSKAFAVASDAVAHAMEQGRLRPGDTLVTSLAIWASVHGVATVVLQDLGLGAEFDAAILDTVIDNLLAGLAAPATD